MTDVPENLVQCDDAEIWMKVLGHYAEALSKKVNGNSDAIDLDNWYQNELPKAINGRKSKHINKEELVKLMKWKLTRGKFRPRLSQMVQENSQEEVKQCSKTAFESLPNTRAAVESLSKLKAVGPATASAVLAAGAPEEVPFMADETMLELPPCCPVKYTPSAYMQFTEEVNDLKNSLNKQAQEKQLPLSGKMLRVVLLLGFAALSLVFIPAVQKLIPENSATSPDDGIQYYVSLLFLYRPFFHNVDQAFKGPERVYLSDLLYAFPATALMLVARILFDKFVATLIGRSFNLQDRKPRLEANQLLEDAYKRKKKPKQDVMRDLAAKLSRTDVQVMRWFRARRAQDKATVQQRFSESTWRFCFYASAFWYGLYVLWDKDWFWEWKLCFPSPLNFDIPAEIHVYYVIELAFYVSLLVSIFSDVKRADFWEMFVHHILTVALLVISWWVYQIKIGAIVLVIHDSADWLLELAKSLKYLNMPTVRDSAFAVFSVIFVGSRLVIYPFAPYLGYIHGVESYGYIAMWRSAGAFIIFMLWALLVLHIFWTYFLVKAIVNTFVMQHDLTDERSDSEIEYDDDDDDGDENANNNKKKN